MGQGRERPDKSQRRPKSRPLGEDDAALWRQVSRTVAPLPRAKPRVPEVEDNHEPLPSADQGVKRAAGRAVRGGAAHGASPKQAGSTSPSPPRAKVHHTQTPHVPKPSSVQPAFDRRQTRRIAKGHVEIDARIDLHGLTQNVAHARLVSFLSRAAGDGMRLVLVITGKGSGWRSRDAAPLAVGRADGEPGVLRRNVPRWLAEPGLRQIVSGFGPAARHHGGDGAFYVQLRRRRSGN
jgi:DNA-nicking Smr family endonuclease